MSQEPEQPRTNALARAVGYLPFKQQLIAMSYAVRDRKTPLWVKTAVVGSLAYLVVPMDFLPDVLPILGVADDAGGLLLALRALAGHTTDEHRRLAREWLETNT